MAQNQLYELLKREHPNIVHVRQVGPLQLDQSLTMFVDMELCEKDLETYNKERWTEPLTDSLVFKDGPMKIWDIISQIVAGLTFLHDNQEPVVHRDLKPANGRNSHVNLKLIVH